MRCISSGRESPQLGIGHSASRAGVLGIPRRSRTAAIRGGCKNQPVNQKSQTTKRTLSSSSNKTRLVAKNQQDLACCTACSRLTSLPLLGPSDSTTLTLTYRTLIYRPPKITYPTIPINIKSWAVAWLRSVLPSDHIGLTQLLRPVLSNASLYLPPATGLDVAVDFFAHSGWIFRTFLAFFAITNFLRQTFFAFFSKPKM